MTEAFPTLSVVVPVFREEAAILPFLARTVPVLDTLGGWEVVFCADPSGDGTVRVIRDMAARDPRIGLLLFSRRVGQPAATMAGILACRGEACVVIDVDLQDPPELIPALHRAWREGHDVVLARRRRRAGETWPKRVIAALGYRAMARLAEVPIPPDTGDFRLISRRVVEALRRMPQRDCHLRGMVAEIGLPTTVVEYDRDARAAGAGHYNRFTGSLRIGLNGLLGFSTRPLRWLLWAGVSVTAGAVLLAGAMLGFALAGAEVGGTPWLAVLVVLAAGVQLAALGLVAEYVARIHDEVRPRPRWIVAEAVNLPTRDDGAALP